MGVVAGNASSTLLCFKGSLGRDGEACHTGTRRPRVAQIRRRHSCAGHRQMEKSREHSACRIDYAQFREAAVAVPRCQLRWSRVILERRNLALRQRQRRVAPNDHRRYRLPRPESALGSHAEPVEYTMRGLGRGKRPEGRANQRDDLCRRKGSGRSGEEVGCFHERILYSCAAGGGSEEESDLCKGARSKV
ncbi:hypothetical protein H4582DRAFT_250450 [Lactarius indigo]|nr:hypothetical protein H4582DRAFT_250450 [Lactarius indigo]